MPLEPKRHHGQVAFVIDRDTLILSTREHRLRLWGVDAPEKGEQGTQRATIALRSLVDGKRIAWIEVDVDRYGRSVARVFLDDGREVNRLMIEGGSAREYCRYSKGFYGRC
ncbi:MAG: thermonuclease family protein [Pseudomonadota bacterium]